MDRLNVKIVNADAKDELIKGKKNHELNKKNAIKSMEIGKGFVTIVINQKGDSENFVSGELEYTEAIHMIKSIQKVALKMVKSLVDVPCDCSNCKNKLSGVT